MSLKSRGVLWTLAAYATALVVAGAVAVGTHDSGSLPSAHADLWTALAADLAATLTVFVFSVGTKNHSMTAGALIRNNDQWCRHFVSDFQIQ